jgi:hypothetical protein
MKKLILLFVISVASLFSFAQKTATISKVALASGKKSGQYSFVLPTDITAKQVDAVKGYYKDYFTTVFNPTTHSLQLNLLSKEEMNLQVINRIMLSLDIQEFNVGQEKVSFTELFEQYLK